MAEGTRQNAVSRHKRQTTLASGGKLRVIPGPWLGIRACRYDVRASLVPLQFIELLFTLPSKFGMDAKCEMRAVAV